MSKLVRGGGIGIDVDIPAWKDFRILVPMAKSANSLEKTQEAMSEDVTLCKWYASWLCGGSRGGRDPGLSFLAPHTPILADFWIFSDQAQLLDPESAASKEPRSGLVA